MLEHIIFVSRGASNDTAPNFDCQTLHTGLHLVGAPIYKKHRNLLIYGALMLFLKAFVKSFVFVSAEREALEPVLSQNITQLQIPINNQLITIIIKSKYYRISLAISIFGCIFGCRISNTPSHEHQTKHHFCT